jgi:two-component system sensor histidine kinase/response regulator
MTQILLIDDETRLRENTAEILELHGYTIVTAQDGIEGFAKAMIVEPDLILCDVMMPNSDGYDFLNRIKKTHLSHIPVILLTARAEREDERHGMTLGADDYITKPFEISEVISSIETRLNKVKQLKQVFSQYSNQSTYELAKLINGHEIRTPLNIISGMAMLLFDLVGDEQKKQAAEMIKYAQTSIFNITSLTNNIYIHELLKSNIDEKIFLETKSINILENIKALSNEFNRKIEINFDPNSIENPKFLYLKNYISIELLYNAIKFTNNINKISFHSYIDNNNGVIKVIDDGDGFNASINEIKAFKKFSKRTDISGLGLGLSNIKAIADKLNGSIQINANFRKCEVVVSIPIVY